MNKGFQYKNNAYYTGPYTGCPTEKAAETNQLIFLNVHLGNGEMNREMNNLHVYLVDMTYRKPLHFYFTIIHVYTAFDRKFYPRVRFLESSTRARSTLKKKNVSHSWNGLAIF